MDNSAIPMKIIGVGPGDTFTFGTNMKVKVFPTCHRVPSQGYAVYVKKKGELLPEMRGLTGAEIKELKMMGQAILSPDTEELHMVYTGDTTLSGLLQYDSSAFIFRSHTLIIEVTYLDGEKAKAEKYGHVHIEDIVENAHLFYEVEHLVFVHLSQKYSLSRAVKLLRDQLPTSLLHKVSVSLHSFGATECLTRLTDKRWDYMQNTQAGWGWSNRNNYANNNTSNSRYNSKLSSSSSDGNLRYPAADRNDTRKADAASGTNSNGSGSVYISANTTTSMDSMTISESVAVTYPSVVTIAPVLEMSLPALTISSDTPPIPSQSRSSNIKNSTNRNNTSNGQHYNSNNPHSNNSSRNKNKKNNRGVVRSAHSHWGINRPYKQPGQVYMNNHHQSGSGNKDSNEQH